MIERQYLPVNWTDGMKINKTHFINQDNAFNLQLARTAAGLLNECNYGLMPYADPSAGGFRLFLSADNQQQVNIRLLQCKAITRGGYGIQITNGYGMPNNSPGALIPDLSVPFSQLKGRNDMYFVVLSINPFERVPYGVLNPEELPARLPYTIPAYQLSLVPADAGYSAMVGEHHLTLGKVKVEEQRVNLDENYIPPCTSVSSHTDLIAIHAGIEQFYTRMESYVLQIIQKIHQKKQVNEMAAIVQQLSETIAILIASQLAEIRSLSICEPPVFLINKVSSLARLFKNTMDYFIGSGKEEFITYCNEWCNVSQTELETSVINLSNHQYNHLDVNNSVDKVLHFTRTISNLFGNLSRLDYIGKKKDAGIFVKEKVMAYDAPEQPIKRKSFLAD
jgi:hypothetical protein